MFYIKLRNESLDECIKNMGGAAGGLATVERARFWGLTYSEDLLAETGTGYGVFDVVDITGIVHETVTCPTALTVSLEDTALKAFHRLLI